MAVPSLAPHITTSWRRAAYIDSTGVSHPADPPASGRPSEPFDGIESTYQQSPNIEATAPARDYRPHIQRALHAAKHGSLMLLHAGAAAGSFIVADQCMSLANQHTGDLMHACQYGAVNVGSIGAGHIIEAAKRGYAAVSGNPHPKWRTREQEHPNSRGWALPLAGAAAGHVIAAVKCGQVAHSAPNPYHTATCAIAATHLSAAAAGFAFSTAKHAIGRGGL